MGKSWTIIALACVISSCLIGNIACTQAELSFEMLRGLQMIQMQTGYVVDDVLSFLKSFETDINNQILNIDEAIKLETEYLEQLLSQLEDQRLTKKGECSNLSDETQTIVNEYTKQSDFVNWITSRINENYQKIEDYHKSSCQQTLDFIEYLRNAQNALNFIRFLRQAITNYSFTQLRSVALVVNSYSSNNHFYSSSKGLQYMLLELEAAVHQVDSSKYHSGDSLNQTKPRTSDEIGTGHIDNDKGDIQLDGFNGGARRMGLEAVKEELFKILDSLEKMIQQGMNDKITSMIQLAETTADYIIALEKEIEYLQKELIEQQIILREIELKVKEAQDIVEQCDEEYDAIVEKIKETKDKHDSYLKDRSSYRSVLLDQLDQLTAIIKIYEEKIFTTGQNFKERYDDILDNQKIDYTANVDDRELKIEYGTLENPEDLDDVVETHIIPTQVEDEGWESV